MTNQQENKEKTQGTEEKKPEQEKELIHHIIDLIKNPITTGLTGLAAGYMIGTYKAGKEIEAIKEEHRIEKRERDQQFSQLIEQIQIMNKHIGISMGMLLEGENKKNLKLEEDKSTGKYVYKTRGRHYQLK